MDKDITYYEPEIATEEVVAKGLSFEYFNMEELAKHLSFVSNINFADSLYYELEPRVIYFDLKAFYDKKIQNLSKQLKKITDDIVKIKFAQLKNTLPVMVSLFFGLCCSSPTYIFDAIFGSSASRIPSI